MSHPLPCLKAHAKINLDLRVTGVLPGGYHAISTVFQSLDLHDTVSMAEHDGALTVRSSHADVPVDGDNLCAKAAAQMWRVCGRPGAPRGWRIVIDKQVPMAAGLGGGSSDAAATILGLAMAWGIDPGDGRLAEAASLVGADLGYFLLGGTALGVGRGNQLTPLPDLRQAEVVLVQPPFGLATADVYRWHDEIRRGGRAGLRRAGRRRLPQRPAVGRRDTAARDPGPGGTAARPRCTAGGDDRQRVRGLRPLRPRRHRGPRRRCHAGRGASRDSHADAGARGLPPVDARPIVGAAPGASPLLP